MIRIGVADSFSQKINNEGNRLSATKIASGEVILYTWDYRNRLTDITYKTSDTGTITKRMHYTYDVNDLRSGKQVDSDGNGSWDILIAPKRSKNLARLVAGLRQLQKAGVAESD